MSTTGMTIDPESGMLGEVEMDGRDLWEKIHHRAGAGAWIRTIARELRISLKSITDSGDVDHGFRRSGTLVGA